MIKDDCCKAKCEIYATTSMACQFLKLGSTGGLRAGFYSGCVAAGQVPSDRWGMKKYFCSDESTKDKTWMCRANWINQDGKTLAAMWSGVFRKEIADADPHQQLILEPVWEIFDNGVKKFPEFVKRQIGVYMSWQMPVRMLTSTGQPTRHLH